MSALRDIPELLGLQTRRQLVRIPPETDVPLTPRVQRLIDTASFRRLSQISQLGLVSLVYPAAHHTRFEHSLGVYHLALLYLTQLSHDDRFLAAISPRDAELFIASALLHDIGHWPFCHPLEDLRLPELPRHESLALEFLASPDISQLLRSDWGIEASELAAFLAEKPLSTNRRLLSSLLSGPIDIDKMDYLARDSLHAGVPYGRNFDQQRLIGGLCLNRAGDGLAIREKGRTAAEMMVFARYVMFSEVYWHHAVRSATAMLQRAFYLARHELHLPTLLRLDERAFIASFATATRGQPAGELGAGLFGPARMLYKRLAQVSFFQERDLYLELARRPYPFLTRCAEEFSRIAAAKIKQPILPHEILFDAPPVKREIEFQIDIFFPKEDTYRPLAEVSPVVEALAQRQFDDYVKRVRIFVHPRLAAPLRQLPGLHAILRDAIAAANASHPT